MMNANSCRSKQILATAIVVLTFMVLWLPASILAAKQVSGRYLKSSGNTITLQLLIENPAPQNLILEQYLPAGTKVLQTSPRARVIRSNGVAKWLFKNISAGKRVISMKIDPPLKGPQVRAVLRYRSGGGGGMVEQQIMP